MFRRLFDRQSVPKTRLVAALLLALFWLAIDVSLAVDFVEQSRLRANGELAVATIKRIDVAPKGADSADVSFVTRDGERVVTTIDFESAFRLRANSKQIEIVYDRDQPTKAAAAHINTATYWFWEIGPFAFLTALIAWFCGLLVGLPWMPKSKEKPVPDPTLPRIVVRRPTAWGSKVWRFAVFVDGTRVGSVIDGEAFKGTVSPGEHVVEVRLGRETSERIRFTAASNSRTNFEVLPRQTSALIVARGAPRLGRLVP